MRVRMNSQVSNGAVRDRARETILSEGIRVNGAGAGHRCKIEETTYIAAFLAL